MNPDEILVKSTSFRERVRRVTVTVFLLSLLALFVGALIPGPWRDAVETRLFSSHFPFSSLAHFVLFALITFSACAPPLAKRPGRVLWFAFGLAIVSEGLQHFAVERHPRLLDVVIDMTGGFLGVFLASAVKWEPLRT